MIRKKIITIVLIFSLSFCVFPNEFKKTNVRNPIDEKAAIDEVMAYDVRYGLDVDLFDREIYQRYGFYIDDVYTISIKAESDINANIIVDGKIFDLAPIIEDFTIGGAVVITTAVVPQLLFPLVNTSSVAVLVTKVAEGASSVAIKAAASASFGALISGIKEIIASDGNFQKTLYAIIEGAGEGFKWGAIIAGIENVASSAIYCVNHGSEWVLNEEHELVEVNKIPLLEHNTRSDLLGKNHPDTGVPYVQKVVPTQSGLRRGVFPKFDYVYEMRLNKSEIMASDRIQFESATKSLAEELKINGELAKQFSSKQLLQIFDGDTPDGYTWHHNEETGLMQLVNSVIHEKTRHIGGKSIWGGGRALR